MGWILGDGGCEKNTDFMIRGHVKLHLIDVQGSIGDNETGGGAGIWMEVGRM